MITPSSPYWPLQDQTWIEYNEYSFESGYWHPDTLILDITGPSSFIQKFRRTVIKVQDLPYPGIAIVDTPPGIWPDMNWATNDKSLWQGLWNVPGTPAYIGEAGNATTIGFPPECELTVNPIAGEVITASSGSPTSGYTFDRTTGAASAESITWKYRTCGLGPWWWQDQYPDQMRTGLEERPGTFGDGNWVYSYLFAKGIGMVWFAWGLRQSDNRIAQGKQWQIANHS